MKKIQLFFLALFFISLSASSQKFEIGLNAIAGYTIVNVQTAMEKVLTDWNQFSYGGNVYGLFGLKENLSVGLETGFHQLYFWEEYYGYGGYYRWGDISTIHLGPIAELKANNLFAQTGLNLRFFINGSGIVPALMFGGGYKIPLTGSISLPVGVRADVVFGSATPIAVNLTIGIRFGVQ